MHRHRFSHPVDSESSRWDRRDRSKLPSTRETFAPQFTSLGTPAEVKPRKAQLSVVNRPVLTGSRHKPFLRSSDSCVFAAPKAALDRMTLPCGPRSKEQWPWTKPNFPRLQVRGSKVEAPKGPRGQIVTINFPGLSGGLAPQIGLETWTPALHW